MELITESRLEGVFDGFDKDRVFELTNGQKWQQVFHGHTLHYLNRPFARIWTEGASYYLEIEGVAGTVLVRRI